MEMRALVAVVLSLVVLLGFQYFMSRSTPPAPPVPQGSAPVPQEQRPAPQEAQPQAGLKGEGAPLTGSVPERTVKIDTPLYSAELSSRGGVITRWVLKNYTDKSGAPISLLKSTPVVNPLAIGRDTEFTLQNAVFTIIGSDLDLKDNHQGTVVLRYASADIIVKRTMIFRADSYLVEITDEVSKAGDYWVTLGGDFGITTAAGAISHDGPVYLEGANREEFQTGKIKEPVQVVPKDLKWIASEDNYFFSALVPSSNPEEVKIWSRQEKGMIAFRLKAGVNTYKLFAGPKDIDQLKPLKLDLEHIVDFGFFSILARPLFWMLKFINAYVGNYGWSIIVLTILLRIPFIPLLNKGQKSMRKLQELQPKMTEIREKFKKDPQRMQREMMELYRKYKVNPMGGCFPMLLQIPFFFALYKVLMVAIELRDAPWMFWIKDLSAKDPIYVLPILMGITMVVQQKMTPTSADPTQQKIMMIMPVIFTFMFLNFSSGLVLYWLMGNILSIIQQIFVNRSMAREAEA
ncbi:MAG: membrane protein insertase YidC [bacterium]